MTRSLLLVSMLLLCALVNACTTSDAGNATDASTSTTTTSATNPTGNQSGSVTSAPGSATDGTVGDTTPTMATATATASTTTSSGSTGEACEFLSCDDMGDGPIECGTWSQDCPEGQKCIPSTSGEGDAWDATTCVEVTGTDKPGEPCTSEGVGSGVDSCIKGAMCWYVNMDGVGTCLALCTGIRGCENNGICTISSEGTLNLCLPPCHPLLQDCSGQTEVCYPIYDGFTCMPDGSGDEGQVNDPCELINGCDEGLMCGNTEFVGAGCMPGVIGCCTPFCKFPDGPCPNPDQQCVQYFDPMTFPENDPLLDIGVCGVPG